MTGRPSGLGIPQVAYHSAHKPPAAATPIDSFEGHGVRAFVADLMTTDPGVLLARFASCDVLVTDLPWQRGYETFNERAGITDRRTYPRFMRAVSALVEAATVPTWLITGAHAARLLPTPAVRLGMTLNDDRAVAFGYRPGPEVGGNSGEAREFLHTLAQRYDCAGDFCAGYGRTGRFFARAGKKAVLSDFNPQCIGYIAAHAAGWAAP